jgi:maleate isomerase
LQDPPLPTVTSSREAIVRAYVGGWRARIGLIYPSSGKRDQDFQQLAPDGVTVHITRVALSDPADLEHIGRMSETRNLVAAARLLADLQPHCISWADTSGSFMFGPNGATEQAEAIRRATGVPASTTSTAVLLALRRLRVRRVAVASPYIDEVNRKLVEFFTSHDFEIGRLRSLELSQEGAIHRASPETVYRLARAAWFDGAEALFIPCTDFEAINLIHLLERNLGKPVVTANQATMWHALRLAGITDGIAGFGQLMEMDLPLADLTGPQDPARTGPVLVHHSSPEVTTGPT